MPLDNFTMRRYRALTECPQGQQPGEVFEATEDAGHVLVTIAHCAERVPDDTPLGRPPTPRGSYNRRDLRASK